MPMKQSHYHYPRANYTSEQSSEQSDLYSPVIDRQGKLLLIVHGLFAAAHALSGTFVTVYLWKVSNDFVMIGWFFLAHQLANALTFWIAGKWVKESNKMNVLRLGVALSAVFYLLVLFLQEQAVNFVYGLGVVQGVAAGLFWLAFNVVYFEITGPGNRDKFNGLSGLLGSGANMVAPWLSGFLIMSMTNSRGYTLIFSLSLLIFLAGVIVSFFLKKRDLSGEYKWLGMFKQLDKRHNPWHYAFPALIAQGLREGLFGFIIGLLVYIATQNELHVGNYALVTSAVALFSFMLAGKFLRPEYRNTAMLWGTLTLPLVILPFYWKLDFTTLLIFGIGTALFLPLFTIPMVSSVFDLIGQDNDSVSHRVEYVVLREIALNLGRICGVALFILVMKLLPSEPALISLLLFIGSAPIVAWYYMRKVWLIH